MNKQEAKELLKSINKFLVNGIDSDSIVEDFWNLHGNQEELNYDISSELEGIYESFSEFAKEFHEDVDKEEGREFDSEYVSELNEFYVFCENSGAVFRRP